MGVKIIDNSKKFMELSEDATDRALNNMAIDIERLSKAQVPVGPTKAMLKKAGKSTKRYTAPGSLKSSGYHRKIGKMKYVVAYNKEYALYQHEGGDGKRVVKNYTRAGKKKHFLIDPAQLIASKAFTYLKREIDKIRL